MRLAVALVLILGVTACGGDGPDEQAAPPVTDVATDGGDSTGTHPVDEIDLWSSAFADGGEIPVEHTCDGEGVSPPLSWSHVPGRAASLVLLVEDPDAPGDTFFHWAVAGLDPELTRVEGGASDLPIQGVNSADELGWTSPCPPEGDEPHRYEFTVIATLEPLELSEGFTADDLRTALEGNELTRGTLTGTYAR